MISILKSCNVCHLHFTKDFYILQSETKSTQWKVLYRKNIQSKRTAVVNKKMYGPINCALIYNIKYFRRFRWCLWLTKERHALSLGSNHPLRFLLLSKIKYLGENFRIQVTDPCKYAKVITIIPSTFFTVTFY